MAFLDAINPQALMERVRPVLGGGPRATIIVGAAAAATLVAVATLWLWGSSYAVLYAGLSGAITVNPPRIVRATPQLMPRINADGMKLRRVADGVGTLIQEAAQRPPFGIRRAADEEIFRSVPPIFFHPFDVRLETAA